MYFYNSLPVAFTLPIAIYFHAKKNTHHTSPGVNDEDILRCDSHSTIRGHPVTGQHQNQQNILSHESSILSRLMELTFGSGSSQRLNLIELDALTNTLTCVNYESFDPKAFLCETLSHVLFAMLCLLVYRHTVLGMCCKIVVRKLHHKSTHFLLVSRSFLRRENILQYVHSWASSADGDIDEDDEEKFLDCDESFVGDNPVAREESVPKTNHQEEKLFFSSDGDVASVSTTQESRDTAVVTTVDDWCKQDSGFMVATTQPVGTSMSHEDQIGIVFSSSATSHQEQQETKEISLPTEPPSTALALVRNWNIFNSTFANGTLAVGSGEVSPEKFKRFLHERIDDIERMGISFDSMADDGDDGYLEESDEDGNTDKMNMADGDQSIPSQNIDASAQQGFWERVTLLM